MLLRKESLEKIDVCRDFLAYVTAGPRTCLNHLYRSQLRSVSKSVCDAGKFQPFLILATLTPPPPPYPSFLTCSPHPSLPTHSSTRKEMERPALFLLPNSNSSLVLYFHSACDRSFVSFPVSAAA